MLRPTWKALKFRGSSVLAGTYQLVSQSETQMTFAVNAPFQEAKKNPTTNKNTHPQKYQRADLPLDKCK